MKTQTLTQDKLNDLLSRGWEYAKAGSRCDVYDKGNKKYKTYKEIMLTNPDGGLVSFLLSPDGGVSVISDRRYDRTREGDDAFRTGTSLYLSDGNTYIPSSVSRKASEKQTENYALRQAERGITLSTGKSTARRWEIVKGERLNDWWTYLEALAEHSDKLQISPYIGKFHRNAVVVDIDDTIKGGAGEDYDKQVMLWAEKSCKRLGLPLPDMFTINGTSLHVQMWWQFTRRMRIADAETSVNVHDYFDSEDRVLHPRDYNVVAKTPSRQRTYITEPFTDKWHPNANYRTTADDHRIYLDIMHTLSYLLGGDLNATGSNYKNPFCNYNESGRRRNKEADIRGYWLCDGIYRRITTDDNPLVRDGHRTYGPRELWGKLRKCLKDNGTADIAEVWGGLERACGDTPAENKVREYRTAFRTDFEERTAGDGTTYDDSGAGLDMLTGDDGWRDTEDIKDTKSVTDKREVRDQKEFREDYIRKALQERQGRNNFIFSISRHIAYRFGFSEWEDGRQGEYLLDAFEEVKRSYGGGFPGTKHDEPMSRQDILNEGRRCYGKQIAYIKAGDEVRRGWTEEQRRHGGEKTARLCCADALTRVGAWEDTHGVDITALREAGGGFPKEMLSGGIPNARRLRDDMRKHRSFKSVMRGYLTGRHTATAEDLCRALTERVRKSGYLDNPYLIEKDIATHGIVRRGDTETEAGRQYPTQALRAFASHCTSDRLLYRALFKYVLLYSEDGYTGADGGWDYAALDKAVAETAEAWHAEGLLTKRQYDGVMRVIATVEHETRTPHEEEEDETMKALWELPWDDTRRRPPE